MEQIREETKQIKQRNEGMLERLFELNQKYNLEASKDEEGLL